MISEVTRYKVNVQKSIAFLYTSNTSWEFQIKNTKQYLLYQNKEKILDRNQTKYLQDLYGGNCKTLKNEIKELNK